MPSVASRELRNHTAAVLRQVAEGATVTITVNGAPVADVVPHRSSRRRFFTRRELTELLPTARLMRGCVRH